MFGLTIFSLRCVELTCDVESAVLMFASESLAAALYCASRLLSRLRRPLGRFNAELSGVLLVQPLPTIEFHYLRAGHAADRSSAEKAIQNIETNVPPGSTHCDEAAIEAVPHREARALTKGFEFPTCIGVPPV